MMKLILHHHKSKPFPHDSYMFILYKPAKHIETHQFQGWQPANSHTLTGTVPTRAPFKTQTMSSSLRKASTKPHIKVLPTLIILSTKGIHFLDIIALLCGNKLPVSGPSFTKGLSWKHQLGHQILATRTQTQLVTWEDLLEIPALYIVYSDRWC